MNCTELSHHQDRVLVSGGCNGLTGAAKATHALRASRV